MSAANIFSALSGEGKKKKKKDKKDKKGKRGKRDASPAAPLPEFRASVSLGNWGDDDSDDDDLSSLMPTNLPQVRPRPALRQQ